MAVDCPSAVATSSIAVSTTSIPSLVWFCTSDKVPAIDPLTSAWTTSTMRSKFCSSAGLLVARADRTASSCNILASLTVSPFSRKYVWFGGVSRSRLCNRSNASLTTIPPSISSSNARVIISNVRSKAPSNTTAILISTEVWVSWTISINASFAIIALCRESAIASIKLPTPAVLDLKAS